MYLQVDERTSRILRTIQRCNPNKSPVYLVGGAVRDLVLGLPTRDLDFVTAKGSMALSAAARKQLGGVGFTLDDERETARVILNQGKVDELSLDFVRFSGEDLQADLRARDFTINAMALALDTPDQVIDPLGGLEDLKARILRVASAESMALDPLRVIRGVRMARGYDLSIDPETERLMRVATKGLGRITGERIRDEFFKILELPGKARSIELMDQLGIVDELWPEFKAVKQMEAIPPHTHPLWKHTLQVIYYLEAIMQTLEPGAEGMGSRYGLVGIGDILFPYQQEIVRHLERSGPNGRRREVLLFLAALCHDLGKPETRSVDQEGKTHFYRHAEEGVAITEEIGNRLKLANEEKAYLASVVGNHMRLHLLANEPAKPSDRAIYRYFQACEGQGVDIALLSVADLAATYENRLTLERFTRELVVVVDVMEAWFKRKQQVIDPIPLLNGDMLQQELGLAAGRELGLVLRRLKEAQASGEVNDREEALAYARKILAEGEAGER